jgi:predicted Zn-dependent protease
MLFSLQGDLVVFVNGDETPRHSEWSGYYDALDRAAQTHPQPSLRILVVTAGGSPSPTQRRDAAEAARRIKIRSAVMTDSITARAVVTAFGWLRMDMKAFDSQRFEDACAYLEMSQNEREWAANALVKLQGELDSRQATR